MKILRTNCFLLVAVAVSGGSCVGGFAGDFCDVYEPVQLTDAGVARDLVEKQRRAAEAIATNQRLWTNCAEHEGGR